MVIHLIFIIKKLESRAHILKFKLNSSLMEHTSVKHDVSTLRVQNIKPDV